MRRCQKTDRTFAPGEDYFSVVFQRGSELVRWDLARDQWNGPPQGTIGWWTCKVPVKSNHKLTPAPVSVLLDTLGALAEEASKSELAYLLAVLLVRRRVLSNTTDKEWLETEDANPEDVLHLTHPSTNRDFVVPICNPIPDRAQELQEELMSLLFCEG